MTTIQTTASPRQAADRFRRADNTRDRLAERLRNTARWLAHRGAMSPEGVTPDDLRTAQKKHRLFAIYLKLVLETLWAFRLLGWHPGDTLYLTFDQIAAFVSSGTRRPADTQDLMTEQFAIRFSADELREFRIGKDA